MAMTLLALPQAPVWVLDDLTGPTGGHALALAGRLGLPFLRMPVGAAWRSGGSVSRRFPADGLRPASPDPWALGDRAAGPEIVISAGLRGGLRAVSLRARHGSTLIHCTRHANPALPFDLMIATAERRAAPRKRIMPALGPLHVVSPGLLAEARARWRERLAHLPRPHIALIVRRDRLHLSAPAAGHLAARLASDAAARRGSILASISPTIGPAALAALSEGLKPSLHLLYRTDEPGEDPTIGFLGSADVVVVAGGTAQSLSEAQATEQPVFSALLEGSGPQTRRLAHTLAEEGRLRPYVGDLSPWPRQRLDEAGRLAGEIRVALGL